MAYRNHKEDSVDIAGCKGIRLQEGACGRGIEGADGLGWAGAALNEDIWDDEEEEENTPQDDDGIILSSQELVSKRNIGRAKEDIHNLAGIMSGGQDPVGRRHAEELAALTENISASSQAADFTAMNWVLRWAPKVFRVYGGAKPLGKAVCHSLLEAGAHPNSRFVIWGACKKCFVMSPLPLCLVENRGAGGGDLADLAADGVQMLSRVGVKGGKVKENMLSYDLPNYKMPYCSIWTTALSMDLGRHIDWDDISGAASDGPLKQVVMENRQSASGVFSGWSLQAIICKILYTLIRDTAMSGGAVTSGQTVDLLLETDSGYFNGKICNSAAWNLGLNVLEDTEKSLSDAQARLSEKDSQSLVQYNSPISLSMNLSDRSLQLGTQPREDVGRLVGVAAAAWKYSIAATVQGFLDEFGGGILRYVLNIFSQEYNYSLLPCDNDTAGSIKCRVVLDGKDVNSRKAEMMDAIQAFNSDGVKITAKNFYYEWVTTGEGIRTIGHNADTLREYTARAVPAELLYDAYMSGGQGGRRKKLAESSLEDMADRLYEDIWDDEEEEENTLQDDSEIVRSSQELVNKRNAMRAIHDMADMMGGADAGEDIAGNCIDSLVAAPDRVSVVSGKAWDIVKQGNICITHSYWIPIDTGDMLTLMDAGRDQDRGRRIIVRRDILYLPWKCCVTAPLPVCLVEDSTGRAGGSLSDIAADGVRWLRRATCRRKYQDLSLRYNLQRNGVPYCTAWDDVLHIDFGHPADRQAVYDAIFSDMPLEEITSTGGYGDYGGWSMRVILCRVVSTLLNTGGSAGPAQTLVLNLESGGRFRSRFRESAAQYLGTNVLEDTERSRSEAREYLGKVDSSLLLVKDVKELISLHMRPADSRQGGAPAQGADPRLAGMADAAWKYSAAAVIQAFLNEFGNSVLSYVLDLFEQVHGYRILEYDARQISSIKYKVILDGKDVGALKEEMAGAVQAFNADGMLVVSENTYPEVVDVGIDTSGNISYINRTARTVTLREYTARAVPADMLYDAYMSGKEKKKKLAESSSASNNSIADRLADRLYEDIWDDEEEEEYMATNMSDDELASAGEASIAARFRDSAQNDIKRLYSIFESPEKYGLTGDNPEEALYGMLSGVQQVSMFLRENGLGYLFSPNLCYSMNSTGRYSMEKRHARMLLDAGLCRPGRVVVGSSMTRCYVMAPVPVILVEDQGRDSLEGLAADGVRWLSEIGGRSPVKYRMLRQQPFWNTPYCGFWAAPLILDTGYTATAGWDPCWWSLSDIFSGQPLRQHYNVDAGACWYLQEILCKVIYMLLEMENRSVIAGGSEVTVALESDPEYFDGSGGDGMDDGFARSFCSWTLNDIQKTYAGMQGTLAPEDMSGMTGSPAYRSRSMTSEQPSDYTGVRRMLVPALKYSIAATVENFLNAAAYIFLEILFKVFKEEYGYNILPDTDVSVIRSIRYKVILDGKDAVQWKDGMTAGIQEFNDAGGVSVTENTICGALVRRKVDYIREYTAKAVPADMLYDAYMSKGGSAGGKGKKRLAESSLEDMAERLYEDIWNDEEEEERAAVSQSDEEIMKSAAAHTEERIRRMNGKVLGLVPGLFGSGSLKDGAAVVKGILNSAGSSVSVFSSADESVDIFASSVLGCLNRYNEDITKERAVHLMEGGLCRDSRIVVADYDTDWNGDGGAWVMSPVPLNFAEDDRGGDLKGIADDAVRWLKWLSGARARHGGSSTRCWMQRHGVPYPLCWQFALKLDLDVPVSDGDTGGFSGDTGAVVQDEGGWWSLRGIVYSIVRTLLDAEAAQAGGAPREIRVDLAPNRTYFNNNPHDLIQTANQGSVLAYFRDCIITDAEKVTEEAREQMGLKDTDRTIGVLSVPARLAVCSDVSLAKVITPAIKYGMAGAVQSFLDSAGAAVLDAVMGAFRERYGYSMLSIDPEEIRGIKYRVILDGMDAAGWKAQMDSETGVFNRSAVTVIERCISDGPGYSVPSRRYKVKLLQTEMLYDAYMSNGGGAGGKGKKRLAESSLEDMADRLYEDIWDDEEEEENTVQTDSEIIQDARRNIAERHVKDADCDIALLVQMLNNNSITTGATDVYEINRTVVLSSAVSAAPGIHVALFSGDSGTADVFQRDGLYYVDSTRRLSKDTCGALLDAGRCRGDSVVVWEQGSNRNLMVMAPLPVQLVEDQDGGGSLPGMAADGVRWLSEANSLIAEGKIRRVILGRGAQRGGVPYCTTGWMSALFCNIQNDSDINPDDIISGQPLKQTAFVAGGDAWSWWSVQRIACRVLHALAKMEAAEPVLTGGTIKVELASDDEYFYSSIPGMPSHVYVAMNFCNNALNDTEETLQRMRELFGSDLRYDACAGLVGRMPTRDRRSRDKAAGLLVPAAKYGLVSAAEAALNAMMPAVLSDILKLFEDTYGYPLLNAGQDALESIRYSVILDGKDTAGWKDEMMSAIDAFNSEGIEITEYDVYDKSSTAIRKYTARAVPLEALYDAYISEEPGQKDDNSKMTVESAAGPGGNILYDMADRLYEDIWDDEEEEEAAAENTAAADDETYSKEALKGSGELGRKTRHRMLGQYSKEIDTSCGFYQNDENAVLTGVVDRCPYSVTASDKYNFFVHAQRMDSGTIIFDGRAGDLIIHNNESYGIKKFKMTPSVILSEITDETDNVRKKRVVYNDAFYSIMPCTVMIATSPEECAKNEFTKCARIHPEIDEYFDLPTVVPPACGIYPTTGCVLFSDAPVNSTEHYGASFHNILREILLQAAMQDGKFCLDYIVPDWQMKFFSSRGSYRNFNLLTEYTSSIIWCDNAFRRKYRLNTDSGSIRLKDYLTGARQNLRAMRLLSSLMLYDIAVYMNRFADTVSDVLNSLADGNEDNLYYINSLVGGTIVSGSFTVNGKTLDQCAADRDAALAEIRKNGLSLLINISEQGTGAMHSKVYRFTAEPITANR